MLFENINIPKIETRRIIPIPIFLMFRLTHSSISLRILSLSKEYDPELAEWIMGIFYFFVPIITTTGTEESSDRLFVSPTVNELLRTVLSFTIKSLSTSAFAFIIVSV